MATYTYKCNKCETSKNLSFSVKEFLRLSQSNELDKMYCEVCLNNENFIRIFGETCSKISKDKERMLMDIKEDAKKIVNKVKTGDQKMIRQVYGEEV